MTSKQIIKYCYTIFDGLEYLSVRDREYRKLDLDWLLKDFYSLWRQFLNEQNLKYSNKFDCDNFAFGYKHLAEMVHYNSPAMEDAPAVGVVHYLQGGDANKAHAINFVFINGKTEPIFIEPQYGSQIPLYDMEKETVYFGII